MIRRIFSFQINTLCVLVNRTDSNRCYSFEGEAPAWSPNAAVALEEELRSNEINTMVRQLFGSPSEWTASTERYGVLGKFFS